MSVDLLNERKIAVNVEQSVPFFGVTNIEASLRFYVDGLGFELKNKWIVDDRIRWCWLQVGGASLMLQEFLREGIPTGKLGEGVSVYFMCKDALAIYREARTRGLEAKRPFVGNAMWVTGLSDPDGYLIYFESPTDVPEETEYSE
jgi:catechol 2,3-dioxygenase-like lactoylglutathione lyase family enzyme